MRQSPVVISRHRACRAYRLLQSSQALHEDHWLPVVITRLASNVIFTIIVFSAPRNRHHVARPIPRAGDTFRYQHAQLLNDIGIAQEVIVQLKRIHTGSFAKDDAPKLMLISGLARHRKASLTRMTHLLSRDEVEISISFRKQQIGRR